MHSQVELYDGKFGGQKCVTTPHEIMLAEHISEIDQKKSLHWIETTASS